MIALVAGATRGAGRAIAVSLGELGATVYCTGRSVRGRPATQGRPETIAETAEMVTACGGRGIALRVDHTVEAEVAALFAGLPPLDVLVNDVWGGDELSQWFKPFWTMDLTPGLQMQQRAVHSHIITSRYGVPPMVARRSGLVIEITDGVGYGYRGELFYSLAKISTIHLAVAMAGDLAGTGVTALALTPGFLRSEAMLEDFGVTEANWRDAIAQHPDFAASETPYFIGRTVAALAADPQVGRHAGKSLSTWDLAQEYGTVDTDGRQPNWGRFFTVWRAALAEVRRLHGVSEGEAYDRIFQGERSPELLAAVAEAQARG
ncbi:MAG TPA: SDR family oxidoreductase [Bacillota bacterium]|nr:SDR family oxidoreductase [Bacillota bacterium]